MRRTLSYTLMLAAIPLFSQTPKAAGNPASAQHSEVIKAVRDYALSYTRSLPNYTCTLTTREVAMPPNAGNKSDPRMTKIEEQLGFLNGKELRKVTRIDGEPVSPGAAFQLPESTGGQFANLLDGIFEPSTGADLAWGRSATLNKRKVDVIAFRVPQAHGYVLNGTRGSVRAPFEGFVYADAETHAVLRIQFKCIMIPDDFEMQGFDLTLDYKATLVAGHEAILPAHFILHYRDFADDREHNDDGQYSAYQQFSSSTSIDFEPAK